MKKALDKSTTVKQSDSGSAGNSANSKESIAKAVVSNERCKGSKPGHNRGSEGLPGKVKSAGEWINTGVRFLREARNELKKVKWPTKKELLASTAVVIVLVLIVSLYLGIVDFGLIKLVKGVIG